MNNFYRLATLIFIWIFGVPPAQAQSFDACQLYGKVYVTDDPREANFKVFVEETEAFADLVVYEEENQLFADKPGLWFITDTQAFANFTIYFEKSRGMADLTIFYTDILSFAGCNN